MRWHFMRIFFMTIAMVNSAQAAIDIKQCKELKKDHHGAFLFACLNTPGCGMVIKGFDSCDRAKLFIGQLETTLAGRHRITNKDVFEAIADPAIVNKDNNDVAEKLRIDYEKQKKIDVVSGRSEDGTKWIYEGPYIKGQRQGVGIFVTDKGLAFLGVFKNDNQIGLGEERYYKYGIRIVGEFENLLANGKGVMLFPDGGRYVGELQKGGMNGIGSLYGKLENGVTYTNSGTYVHNQLHGKGKTVRSDGMGYEGDYVNGQMTGIGKMTRLEGVYEGALLNGKFHGKGTYKLKTGDSYLGEWENGKLMNGAHRIPGKNTINIFNGKPVDWSIK